MKTRELEPAKQQEPKIKYRKTARSAVKKAASLGMVAVEAGGERPQRPGLAAFTLAVIYKNLYILGITLLRQRRRFARRSKFRFLKLIGALYAFFDRVAQAAGRFFASVKKRFLAPFLRIKSTYIEVKPSIAAKRKLGKFPFAAYLAVLETIARLILKILTTIFNYAAPVVAAAVLLTVVRQKISEPMILVVDYKDKIIGYIQNEAQFTAATRDVLNRVSTDGSGSFSIASPKLELMTLREFRDQQSSGDISRDVGYLDESRLPDMLMQESDTDIGQAYGLYINKRFIGAVTDKNAVLNELTRIREENLTGKPDERVSFVKSIEFNLRLYPQESIVSDERVLSVINSNETSDEIYVVQEGDTPTGIADKTGVPYAVLKELNPDIEGNLYPGTEVYTQVARPFMSVKTTFTDVYEEEVPFETIETQNATYARGYRNVTEDGIPGLRKVKAQITMVNGFETERVELESTVIKQPVNEQVTVGVNDPARIVSTQDPARPGVATDMTPGTQTSSTGFIRPVSPGVGSITCYLNGYWGHTGVDIAVKGGTGTPIMASASGTVVLAKYTRQSYGYYIIIDHGNNYQTLYAHNSDLYVSVGDKVGQGQVIAAMGRTGNASGVHCHFEVRYNGRIMNPVDYIGSR